MADYTASGGGGSGLPQMTWKCESCGTERQKYKAGAKVDGRAVMRCDDCEARTIHTLIEKTTDTGGPLQ
jgi:hypothetical protein